MSFLGVLGPEASIGVPSDAALEQGCSLQFGSSRLSIRGQSPDVIRRGSQGTVLSGRLFGVRELAGRLHLPPNSEPAAALLLHAYREWGLDFPNHVHGEYAFALWDQDSGQLVLGRDPSSYRLLYYSAQGRTIFFGTSIRRLLDASPGFAPRLNEHRVASWLALVPTPSDETFFRDISSIRGGTAMVFERGRITEHSFWKPERTPLLKLRDPREYADGLLDVLDRATFDRLPADTRVASQLSGGLDSSSVTVSAARLLQAQGRGLLAFTAVPAHAVHAPGWFVDEGPNAASVAAMYPNIDHRRVSHGAHSVFSVIDLFNSEQEEPVFNPANCDWNYEICLQAQRCGADTLLTGQMGNLSISYAGDRALQTLLRQGRVAAFARLVSGLHRESHYRWRGIADGLLRPLIPARVRRALDRRFGRPTATHEYSLIRRDFARKHGIGVMALEQAHLGLESRAYRLLFLRRFDLGPAASAMHRLTRVNLTDPTCDRRVIEYCLSVPVEHYCDHGIARSLIRNAMLGRLPDQVRTEHRRGMQAADFALLFQAERREADDELTRLRQSPLAAGALDLAGMEDMLRVSSEMVADRGKQGNYWPKLLRAFSLGRFLRRVEDGTFFSLSPAAFEASSASSLRGLEPTVGPMRDIAL